MQTEEPLRRMELQKKEVQRDYNIQEIRLERAYSWKVSRNSRLKAT